MAAALGHHLVLEVSGGDAGPHVEVDGALDVEQVAVAGVHVDDDGRDLQVNGLDSFLRIAHRHRELELAQRADRATCAVRDLHRRVDVHVRRAQMADGERVPAEIDGVEAVVHDQLGPKRVVHAGPEYIRLGRQEAPKPPARVLVARRRHFEPVGKEGRGDKFHRVDSFPAI